MIQAKRIVKVYGSRKNQFKALDGIDLNIEKGESIAIIGKSGSGKSTLMHVLAGLDTPTSGEVQYNNIRLSDFNGKKLASFRNENIGFVFQQFFLQPNNSCLENVILPLKIEGIGTKERSKRGMEVLRMVGMEKKANNKGTDLSGGEKQRVCIARAIITQPNIIFADEPTGNLDSQTGKTIIDLLFKLNKEKKITLVIVTHDEDLAKLCDRRIQIQDGKIINITREK